MKPGTSTRRVAVLGGGISGLAAAFRLRELAAAHEFPLEVSLFEQNTRLGGALHTTTRDGFILEAGADSFLSEKPAGLALVDRLGISGELIQTREQFRRTYVIRNGRLMEIPAGFSLLAPTYFAPILRTRILSPWGKLRIMIEPFVPRRRDEADESLAAFVKRRLGREALVRIVQPLAAGIYTADPERLSAQATMPRFVEMERRYGSLIRGLRMAARARGKCAGKAVSGARWTLFVSFRKGMGTLVEALAARLTDAIHTDARVTAVALHASPSGRTWTVILANGQSYIADALVCALPAYAAARVLHEDHPELSSALGEIGYASAATVNLVWRAIDFPVPPSSFGFVVPIAEHRRIIACSFSSLKFANRAPQGYLLSRVFIGGALQSELLRLTEAEMITAAREEMSALTGVKGEPLLAQVKRWPEAMPQYSVGHLARAARIEREAAELPAFGLAGAFIRGVGIPDCIASGEQAAAAVFAQLSARV
jgi:oxygen-dependent protoporphyrinogen oxidase